MAYKLVDHGYPFKKIYHNKKWVGRVVKCADGRYYARIGQRIHKYATTEVRAFEEAASEAMGYNSPEALRNHNSAVRADNRVRNARARAWAYRFTNGTLQDKMDVLDEVFDNLGSKRG